MEMESYSSGNFQPGIAGGQYSMPPPTYGTSNMWTGQQPGGPLNNNQLDYQSNPPPPPGPPPGLPSPSGGFSESFQDNGAPGFGGSSSFNQRTGSGQYNTGNYSGNWQGESNSGNWQGGLSTANWRGDNSGNWQGDNSGNWQGGSNSGNWQGDNSGTWQGGPNSGNWKKGPNSSNLQGGPNSGNWQGEPNSGNWQGEPNSGNWQGEPKTGNWQGELKSGNWQGDNSGKWQGGSNSGNWQEGPNSGNWQGEPNPGNWQGDNSGEWQGGPNSGNWPEGLNSGNWQGDKSANWQGETNSGNWQGDNSGFQQGAPNSGDWQKGENSAYKPGLPHSGNWREGNNSGFQRGGGNSGFQRGRGNSGFQRGGGNSGFQQGGDNSGFQRGRGNSGFQRGRGNSGFQRGRGNSGFQRGGGNLGFQQGGNSGSHQSHGTNSYPLGEDNANDQLGGQGGSDSAGQQGGNNPGYRGRGQTGFQRGRGGSRGFKPRGGMRGGITNSNFQDDGDNQNANAQQFPGRPGPPYRGRGAGGQKRNNPQRQRSDAFPGHPDAHSFGAEMDPRFAEAYNYTNQAEDSNSQMSQEYLGEDRAYCRVCNIYVATGPAYTAHIKSSFHLQNVLPTKKQLLAVLPAEFSALEDTFIQDHEDVSLDDDEQSRTLAAEEQAAGRFYCEVCDLTLHNESMLITHKAGKRHEKALRRQKRRPGVSVWETSFVEDISDFESRFQFSVSENEPVVGLEYVVETVRNAEVFFICTLCDSKGACKNIKLHVTGLNHRSRFMRYFDFAEWSDIKKRSKSEQQDPMIEACRKAEESHGRGITVYWGPPKPTKPNFSTAQRRDLERRLVIQCLRHTLMNQFEEQELDPLLRKPLLASRLALLEEYQQLGLPFPVAVQRVVEEEVRCNLQLEYERQVLPPADLERRLAQRMRVMLELEEQGLPSQEAMSRALDRRVLEDFQEEFLAQGLPRREAQTMAQKRLWMLEHLHELGLSPTEASQKVIRIESPLTESITQMKNELTMGKTKVDKEDPRWAVVQKDLEKLIEDSFETLGIKYWDAERYVKMALEELKTLQAQKVPPFEAKFRVLVNLPNPHKREEASARRRPDSYGREARDRPMDDWREERRGRREEHSDRWRREERLDPRQRQERSDWADRRDWQRRESFESEITTGPGCSADLEKRIQQFILKLQSIVKQMSTESSTDAHQEPLDLDKKREKQLLQYDQAAQVEIKQLLSEIQEFNKSPGEARNGMKAFFRRLEDLRTSLFPPKKGQESKESKTGDLKKSDDAGTPKEKKGEAMSGLDKAGKKTAPDLKDKKNKDTKKEGIIDMGQILQKFRKIKDEEAKTKLNEQPTTKYSENLKENNENQKTNSEKLKDNSEKAKDNSQPDATPSDPQSKAKSTTEEDRWNESMAMLFQQYDLEKDYFTSRKKSLANAGGFSRSEHSPGRYRATCRFRNWHQLSSSGRRQPFRSRSRSPVPERVSLYHQSRQPLSDQEIRELRPTRGRFPNRSPRPRFFTRRSPDRRRLSDRRSGGGRMDVDRSRSRSPMEEAMEEEAWPVEEPEDAYTDW